MSILLLNEVTEVTSNAKQVERFTHAAVAIEGTATVELSVMAGNKEILIQTVTASKVYSSGGNYYKPNVQAKVVSIGASSSVTVEV